MLTIRLFVLSALLALLHHLHNRRYHAHLRERTARYLNPLPAHTALVTLADPSFAPCAVQLLTQARRYGWERTIVLLAVNYGNFSEQSKQALQQLGVLVVHTAGILDAFADRGVENMDVYRRLDKRKLRKLELFFHQVLRTYERWIYLDADGRIDGSLEPLARVRFPKGVSVMMRQNDRTLGKGTLWQNEMAVEMLTEAQMIELSAKFADRELAGGSCWFVVDVAKMDPPVRMVERVLQVVCRFRAAFRFNDQTVMALMFYNEMSMFPWCLWEGVAVLQHGLKEWCEWNWKMQKKVWGRKRFMYRHLNSKEKSRCVRMDSPVERLESHSAELEEHRIDPGANCDAALQQWRKRLEVDKTV